MKFSISYNRQKDFLKDIDFSNVWEVFGTLGTSILSGKLRFAAYRAVSSKTIEKEIKVIQSQGLEFNYYANELCLDNRELGHSMQSNLKSLFSWLVKIKVNSVTVSLPYLSRYIRKNFPQIKINISSIAQVDTLDKAKFWEDLGVSRITLDLNVNRNFELIKKIRNSVKCQLQLVANRFCMYNCPFSLAHNLFFSHLQQKGLFFSNIRKDFYKAKCEYMRLKDPVNFIRASWIRPEDLIYYERLGIDSIKICNDDLSTKTLGNIVNIYTKRNYNGNLLNMFMPGKWEDYIYIDNSKLNGFLLSLQEKKCYLSDCRQCGWCREIVEKSISIDYEKLEIAIKEIENNGYFIN